MADPQDKSMSSHKTNDAFVLKPEGGFFYEVHAVPAIRFPRDVLIRIVATGLCGSDVHYWQHGRIGDFVVTKPIVLGHESAGIIEACGPDVKNLSIGDRVALEPGISCHTCDICRSGKYNLCASMQFAATPPHSGTLSTFYRLPEECCFLLPEHISLEEGALVEPLSVAVHACKLAGIVPGSSVVVFGAGPVGLLCCAVARAFGASTVAVTDVVQSRLDFALGYSATATYMMSSKSPEANAKLILASTSLPKGADVVIEATGVESCINCGIHALKRGGTFVQAGLGSPKIHFPVGQICDKEANFRGSFRYGPGDYTLAIELLRTGKVTVKELITHRFSFTDAEKAFDTVSKRQGIKSVIYGPGIFSQSATSINGGSAGQ